MAENEARTAPRAAEGREGCAPIADAEKNPGSEFMLR
jgi:hypothetical protein